MKKLTAIVLTLTMLLSMLVLPMGVTATEMTEAERQEILSTREQTYLGINPNTDAFASVETIRNYASLQNAVNSSDAYNKVTTVYCEDGETVLYTYMNQLLNETHNGKPITGNESYYKKGIAYAQEDAVRMSPMLYVTESFDLTKEQLKELPVKTYTDLKSTDTAQNAKTIAEARYADATKFVKTTTKFYSTDLNYLPTVVNKEIAGDNYYVTIKDPETAAQFKLGPINDSEFVKNVLDITRGNAKRSAVVPEGTKGKFLSYAVITADVNGGNTYGDDYALNIGSPAAALSEVQVKYVDGASDTFYVLTTNMTKSPIDDMVGLAIYSADKYDSEGNEITYTKESFLKSTSSTNPLTALTGKGLTLDDVIFPENVDANEINVAISLRARQDTAENNYGNKAAFGTFELQDKEIESVNFIQDGDPGDEAIEGIIPLYNSTDKTKGQRALIPVKLPEGKAETDKVYFAYVGRFANSVAVLGATISSETLQEKIDALNEILSALDSAALTEEDVASYRAQIAELKAESEYILDTDFDTSKLDAAEERIEEEKAQERAEEIVNASNVTQFPLSAATGANSRLFVKKGTESEIAESGYLEGIDFFGRLADSVAAEEDKYIAYSMEGETPAANLIFKQDEGGKYVEITHFEEETKKYYVNPDEKVIKIMKVDATEEYYGENAAAAASLNGCTIDVPDGKYNSIGLLAGAGWLRPVTTTLIYEDGKVEVPSEDAPYIYYWSHENFRGAEGTDKYNYYIANWNYTTASQRGTFRFNTLADFSETTTRIGYKEFTVVSDPSRVLKAVKFASGNTGSPVSIISLWGNKATVAEKLAELEAIDITDEATYEAAKAAIADFDAYLADLGYTVADLASYKTPYTDLKAEIAEYELKLEEEVINSTDDRVWFDLKGNSKFFVKQDSATKYIIGETTYTATNFTDFRTNFKDYLPGVDFAGFVEAPTGDFATDQTEVYPAGYGGFMFLYTVDKNTKGSQYATPDFTTGDDGNLYWSINGDKYRVDPKENVIKVTKNAVDVSALADADTIARYESVNKEAVIDVADGRYKNVGLLTGLNADYNRTMAVTLVYEDETEVKEVKVTTGKLSSDTSYLTGHFYLQNFTNTGAGGSNSNGGHGFVPVTIETDPTKTLTAIKIMDGTTTSTARCFYVVSAWGVAVPEISNASYADGKVTVDYSAVATTKGKVLVVEYSQDEKEFKKITVVPALFTKNNTKLEYYVKTGVGNKVKVFVWRDLIDFFPYK